MLGFSRRPSGRDPSRANALSISIRVLAVSAVVVLFAAISWHAIKAEASQSSPAQNPSSAPSAQPSADLVLTNAIISTMDESHPRASMIAIRGETIVAVAYNISDAVKSEQAADVQALIGPNTRVIDLHGQFAMPGFNDAHAHLFSAAYAKLEVDLSGAKSLAEFQQRIRDRLKDYKPGEWILGRGWDHTLWPEKKFPTRQDLDAVSTEHPMLFSRLDGHVAVANSRALKIAGITGATQDPPNGHIERDAKSDEPTGMLEEDSAMNLVFKRVPPYSAEQRLRGFGLVMDEAAQYGVTSVQDNSVMDADDSANSGWNNFLLLQQLQREGKLKFRVTEWLPFDASLPRLEEMRRAGGSSSPGHPGDSWLTTGQLKLILDGSLGSRTAAMLAPYSDDPNTSGILEAKPDELKQMAIERDRAGFQLGFHAIGDRANRIALDTFAAVLEANGPRDRRDRVEHAQVVEAGDFARFGKLNVIASMQPAHLLDDERWAADRLGPERSRGAYAWHSLEQNNVRLAFGTDYPVVPINPLRGIYACVTRQLTDGTPERGWQRQERLHAKDCFRAYTVGSAYAQFEDQRKGTIAPGMLADIVVYPRDLNQTRPSDILTLPVSMTIVGGKVVYQQPQQ
ncbi:MAG TPA: amidohydrolase family protein [Candidatus Acidoferrales bacterium]|nr:amidohydrolase family protein [Candidatus Acidoferrales bacterium]